MRATVDLALLVRVEGCSLPGAHKHVTLFEHAGRSMMGVYFSHFDDMFIRSVIGRERTLFTCSVPGAHADT
jgi:hypothetical protein